MCQGCWEDHLEDGGRVALTDRVRAAVPIIQAADPAGLLHVIIDDWNLEDDILNDYRRCSAQWTDADRACFDALAPMTLDERYTAMALAEGLLEATP